MNILAQLRDNSYENNTSAILEYLLNGIPAFREKFLRLIVSNSDGSGAMQVADCTISREITIENGNRPDFLITGRDWKVAIENKPWGSSIVGSQLSGYANALKAGDTETKFLCLLATDANKSRLLQEAADAEKINVSVLKMHYGEKYGIFFSVITWEQVLELLQQTKPEHDYPKLWHDALHEYIIPHRLSPEDTKTDKAIIANWEKIKATTEAIHAAVQSKQKAYGYSDKGSKMDGTRNIKGTDPKEPEFWGWFLSDTVNQIKYWVGADRNTWKELLQEGHCLFSITTWSKHNTAKDISAFPYNPQILLDCGFIQTKNTASYNYPLTNSLDEEYLMPETIANKVIEVLNQVRDTLAKQN